jgi:regulator of protease activity HflC (stomatin/prohibitin superfamily)
MNRIAKFASLLVVAVVTLVSTVGCSNVPPGNVGIKVDLWGGDKGVEQTVLPTGLYWIGPSQQLFLYPTFQQNYTWTKDATEGSPTDESITFQTVEGLEVNADFGITYQVEPDKVPVLFQTYRRGIAEITDTFIHNMVRDSINRNGSVMPIEAVYGEGKQKLIDDVQKDVSTQLKPLGIDVYKIYLIGKFRLPDVIVQSINAKIASTQMAQQRENEIAQAKAEALKLEAAADGIAKSNEIKAASLSPQLLAWETLEIQRSAVEKWNGQQPNVLMQGDKDKSVLLNITPTEPVK